MENIKLKQYQKDDVLNILSDVNLMIESINVAINNVIEIVSDAKKDVEVNSGSLTIVENALTNLIKNFESFRNLTNQDLSTTSENLENVQATLQVVNAEIDAIKLSSDSATEQVNAQISEITDKLNSAKEELANSIQTLTIETNKQNTSLSTSINNINNQVSSLNSYLSRVQGELETQKNQVDMHESDIATIEQDVKNLQTTTTEIRNNITTIEGMANKKLRENLEMLEFNFFGANYENGGIGGDLNENWDGNGSFLNESKYVFTATFTPSTGTTVIPIGIYSQADGGMLNQSYGYGNKNCYLHNSYQFGGMSIEDNGEVRVMIYVRPLDDTSTIYGERLIIEFIKITLS